MSRTCFFIAGDPSGDLHTAPIVQKLRSQHTDLRCVGIGGPAMQQAGFKPLMPFEPFNKMGFAEVVRHLPFFLNAKKEVIAAIAKARPVCVVCVDYSGFNIPVMKAASIMGIPVIWYIAPTVWAWKKKRAEVLARYAQHICCIFPFEVAYFKPFTQNVHFVGNPTVEEFSQNYPAHCRTAVGVAPHVALIPGSRFQEISRLVPAMVGAYKLLKKQFPELTGTLSRFKTLPEDFYRKAIAGTDLSLSTNHLSELFARSDVAMVTSGTATLEAAIMAVPHVIVYKTSLLTYMIAKHFVKLPHIGLPNIIAQETVAKELIQQYVTEKSLYEAVCTLLTDKEYYRRSAEKLFLLRTMLGAKSASSSVAAIIGSLL